MKFGRIVLQVNTRRLTLDGVGF